MRSNEFQEWVKFLAETIGISGIPAMIVTYDGGGEKSELIIGPGNIGRVRHGIGRGVSGDALCHQPEEMNSNDLWLVKFSSGCFQIGFAQCHAKAASFAVGDHMLVNFADWQNID
mgnify:CR=1 FL=1